MSDALGVDQQGDQKTQLVPDFLGTPVARSFTGQPALPSTSGAAAGGSTTPTIGGAGKAPSGPLVPTKSGEQGETTFFDLARFSSALGSQGSGNAGPGEGSPTGQNTDAAGGPANIGLSLGFGPGQISIGPTGTVSVGARGESFGTQAVATALNTALSQFGVPTSVNLPSLIGTLSGAPALGIAAHLAGAFGAPFSLVSLAHAIASMSPTSVTNLQAALADPNPEAQLSLAQALALMSQGQRGPTQGGPQAIGNLTFDNPVTNVNASTQAAATTPADNLADMTLSPTFADLAAALGFGTNRGVDPDAPTADPNADAAAAAATASATAGTGVSSSTGSEGSSASGPSGGGGPGSGAPGDGPY